MDYSLIDVDVAGLLAECGQRLRSTAFQRWVVTPVRGATTYAVQVGDWLALEREIPRERFALTDWKLLAAHGRLAGNAKFLDEDGRPMLRVRSEIPLLDGDDEATKAEVNAAMVDLTTAENALRRLDNATEVGAESTRVADEGDRADETSLVERCAAAGWSTSVRPDGTVVVTVEQSRRRWSVEVTSAGDALRMQSTLFRGQVTSERCRVAVGRLLLSLGDHVRLCRAAIRVDEADLLVFVQTTLPCAAGATRIRTGLEALGVACSLIHREVATLAADEDLAGLFLEFSCGSSRA